MPKLNSDQKTALTEYQAKLAEVGDTEPSVRQTRSLDKLWKRTGIKEPAPHTPREYEAPGVSRAPDAGTVAQLEAATADEGLTTTSPMGFIVPDGTTKEQLLAMRRQGKDIAALEKYATRMGWL